jgi:glycosyltransferase involved in cell wall biosynthesis
VLLTQHIGQVPYRNPVLRGTQRLANRVLGRWMLAAADQVVFESDSVRRYFNRFVRFQRPPALIENGVDDAQFRPASQEQRRSLRAAFGVSARAPLALFLGRFVEKKGLLVLERLTQQLPEVYWIIAGWGPIDPAAWKRPNVKVMYSPASIVELYQAADLLVLPSVGEGFPLSVQEAMACGTPALVGSETARGSPHASAVLLHEPTGEADTAQRWAARLRSLLQAPGALEALRPRVAAFAREHWSWERCTARYAELLRACARRR